MARWVEVSLRVDAALSDTVADLLATYGYQGVALEREGIMPDKWDEGTLPPATHYTVRAYLPDDDALPPARYALEQALQRYPVEPPIYRDVAEEDWAEAWKKHYHPIRIGERLVVRPVWETTVDSRPDDIEIVLDPGMAFGTGTHPTTQLCLRALEMLMPADAHVLDLGCGSGILSVAAAKLGAARVYGVDVDPVAVEAALENIERNNVTDAVTLATGSLADVLADGRTYEFAAVNILARIIIEMCDHSLGDVLKPGGIGIFSGVIEPQVPSLEAALQRTGLIPVRRLQQGDWVLIEAHKDKQRSAISRQAYLISG